MLPGKMPPGPSAALVCPDDLVQEPGFPEHLVAHHPGRRRHAPVQVQVHDARLIQQIPRRPDHPPQQPQVFLFPGIPVRVGGIAGRRGARPPSGFPVGAPAHKLLAGHEGRIQVHALRLPGHCAECLRQRHYIPALQQVFPRTKHFLLHADLFKHPCFPPVSPFTRPVRGSFSAPCSAAVPSGNACCAESPGFLSAGAY